MYPEATYWNIKFIKALLDNASFAIILEWIHVHASIYVWNRFKFVGIVQLLFCCCSIILDSQISCWIPLKWSTIYSCGNRFPYIILCLLWWCCFHWSWNVCYCVSMREVNVTNINFHFLSILYWSSIVIYYMGLLKVTFEIQCNQVWQNSILDRYGHQC